MKKKLIDALQTKFQGVDAQILDRIATKKAEGITDESQITSIIDGVSFQDVLTSYGDFRAGDASTTAVKNYEKKHNLKDGKAVESPTPTPQPTPTPNPNPEPNDMATLIANAVSAAVKPLSDKLAGFETQSAAEKRASLVNAKAKEYGIPDPLMKRLNVPEDADLDDYFKDAKQDLANLGFKGVESPDQGGGKAKTDGETFAAFIAKEETK